MINNKEIELTKDILLEEINTRKKTFNYHKHAGEKKKLQTLDNFFPINRQ